MNRLQEIETRLSAIMAELNNEGCDVDALTAETDALIEERNAIEQKAQKRQQTLDKLVNDGAGSVKKDLGKDERKMGNTINKRQAFCKFLLGRDLSTEERGALTIAGDSAGPVVPEEMINDIISKVATIAPVLADIELLRVNGTVRFAVEGVINNAEKHTENAQITAQSDSLVSVTLTAYEVVKLVQISGSVYNMSLPVFDAWLVEKIAERIGADIERQIFVGSGTNEAKGVDKIEWNENNSVTVGASASTTATDVFKLVGMLKSGYARGAKMYLRRTTLFNDLLPLQDKAKHDLVTFANGRYYVLGILAEETDSLKDHEIIYGNMKKYVGNMPEDVHVVRQFDIDHNAHKFLGVAMFDGKPALEEAFVKLVKGA